MKKILIVDDEAANLRALERLFRKDHHVLTAESGSDALALLEQYDVALLVTDQRMPGMTGLEVARLVLDRNGERVELPREVVTKARLDVSVPWPRT